MNNQTDQTPSPAAMRAANEIKTLLTISMGRFSTKDIATIIDRETGVAELREAASALLARLDRITTDDFSRGGERQEREALRALLARMEGK